MDIRTLLVCSLAVLTVHAVCLLLVRLSERDLTGIGWLAAAFAVSAVGTALGAGRDIVPDFWSIVVGNALLLVGYILLHRAITSFLGLGFRHLGTGLALLAVLVAGLALFTYGVPDTRLRIAVISVTFAIQAGLSAALLLRRADGSGSRLAERSLGGVLVCFAAFHVVRGALTLWRGTPDDFMRGDVVQSTSLLAAILGVACVAFGFMWMTSARLRATLHRQANRDPLTGLLNRRGFLDLGPSRLRAAAEAGRSILLLFADLDGLKEVNDTVGHDAGDRAIYEAAEVLRDVLRASDTLARLGGDEFCALTPVASPADGEVILRRIESRVQARNALPGREYSFGISAAFIPVAPTDDLSLEELLRAADSRMYIAKRSRKLGSVASS